jgi:hypothetical protein
MSRPITALHLFAYEDLPKSVRRQVTKDEHQAIVRRWELANEPLNPAFVRAVAASRSGETSFTPTTRVRTSWFRSPKQKARDAELARLYPLLWASCPIELRPDMRDTPDATLAIWEANEPGRKRSIVKDAETRARSRIDMAIHLRQIKADPGEQKMVLLLEELRRADETSNRDISQSIADLYLSITTNFRTIDGLKAAPSKTCTEYFAFMHALEERMIKADMHGWAITRLFNKWALASVLDKKEDAARLAYDLAFFMPDHKFPPAI